MASFSSVAEDPRKRLPATLPLPGARFNIESGKWEGPTIALDIVALTDGEYAEAVKNAIAYARKRGVPEPSSGDELYDHGLMVHTVATACLDCEVKDAEKPFFDGGAEQIGDSRNLLPEVVAYLYNVQRTHQDEVNPLAKDFTPAEYMSALARTAGGDPSFFLSSRPGTQWSFTRILASQQLASMTRGSPDGGSSEVARSTTEH